MSLPAKLNLVWILIFLTFIGCSDKNKIPEQTQENTAITDTSSVVIKYSITGAGQGTISIYRYHDLTRIDLEKSLKSGIGKESRFITGGYVYFFVSAGNILQPVKSKIIKDNNYQKSFSAFTDAGEFIGRMKKSGTEIIAGNVCDVYNDASDGSSFSVFGGRYVLRAAFGGNVITANSVQLNAGVDSNYVKMPGNVDFTEITQ